MLREARKLHQPKRFTRVDDTDSDRLNISARPAKINDLTEINQDRKERKKWLAQSNTDAITFKYNYRTIDSAKLSTQQQQRTTPVQPSLVKQPTNSKQYYQHKGSIFNYRNSNRNKRPTKQEIFNFNGNEQANNNSMESSNFQVQAEPILNPKPSLAKSILVNHQNTTLEHEQTNLDYKLPRVSVNNLSCFGSDFFYESTDHMKNYKANLFYHDLSVNNHTHNLLAQNERRKKRNQHARDKINESNEKTNLNKMTILQPFEDTKILINIDKVSSKILNSLLNKQIAVPRYYMPPIKSVGYFKKVITNDPNSILNAGIAAGFNYPGTAHMSYADHAARHAAVARLESLKSLSEMHSKAPTFYYDDDSEINNKNQENSMFGLNQSSAIKSEASMKSLDNGGRRSSSKGISI